MRVDGSGKSTGDVGKDGGTLEAAQPNAGAVGDSIRDHGKDKAKEKSGRVMPEGMSNSETQRWLREQRAKEEDVPF